MRGFGSDNHAGVHPQILQRLVEVNQGHAPAYGTDELTQQANQEFKKAFGDQAEVFYVFNGTAANVLSLKSLVRSHHSVLCSEVSHLHLDECGAPEALVGCKLITVPHSQGKLKLSSLQQALTRRGDQHFSQVKAISLTQPTELGTVYSLSEIKEICDWAHKENLAVHVDGARLANAAFRLDCSFRQMTTDLGVDVVSFGGTKNGLLGAEAVVFTNSSYAHEFKFVRKQMAQLPSKTRFLAAQFLAYFDKDLWKDISSHACQMADLLYEKTHQISGVQVDFRPQSNAVFAKIPARWVKPLREKYFFYVWDEKTFVCRWMTSWDTQPEDIIGFSDELKKLSLELK